MVQLDLANGAGLRNLSYDDASRVTGIVDPAGRIRQGPAPKNLVVPPYEFISDTLVQIG